MLKVSQKLEYAMRAMIELANRRGEETLVPAREIAERQQIPLRFLEQQLGALSKAGLVESFRGAGGGCRIARDPLGDHHRADRRRHRGPDLPDVLPGAVRPHLLPGLAVRPAGVLGRRGPGGAEGLRRDDGGGPVGPPPTDEPGAGVDRPGDAVVSFSLTRFRLVRLAISPASALLKMRVSFVPHTGQAPCAAGRPFFRVTISPSNVRFSRHFMQ